MLDDPFADAAADLRAEFAEPALLGYTCLGHPAVNVAAVRSDRDLLDGGRRLTYEIAFDAGLPAAPTKRDTFDHAGQRWSVADVKTLHELGAWELTVTGTGPAA